MKKEWKNHWLRQALSHAEMSKDPSTKFGAYLIGDDNEVIANGINGFPRGIKDDDRLLKRETKYKLIVHAEENAIINAARMGVSTKGSTLFLIGKTFILGNPDRWERMGFICSRCAGRIIQAGISKIVTIYQDNIPERWQEEVQLATDLFAEANIFVERIFDFKE